MDSGVKYALPSLRPCIYVNEGETPNNGIDDDWNDWCDDYVGASVLCPWFDAECVREPTDDVGHGTMCASVIQVDADWPSYGLVPPKPPCLVPVRAYMQGTNEDIDVLADGIAEGISYAAHRHIKVILITCGFPTMKASLRTAIVQARSRGLLVVCAAGMGIDDIDTDPVYPASAGLENLLTVTALTESGEIATSAPVGRMSVDLAAPGTGVPCFDRDGNRVTASGTSMAAALTAGAAALVWSHPAYRTAQYCEIKEALQQYSQAITLPASSAPRPIGGGALDLAFLGPEQTLTYRGRLHVDAQGNACLEIGELTLPLDFVDQVDLAETARTLDGQEVQLEGQLRRANGAGPNNGYAVLTVSIKLCETSTVQPCPGVLLFSNPN